MLLIFVKHKFLSWLIAYHSVKIQNQEKVMKSNKVGWLFLILLGWLMIISALLLMRHNDIEQLQAEQESYHVLEQMTQLQQTEVISDEMSEIEIDGDCYIGRLIIPELGLDLPVMSQWSYTKLKKAPCRYSGSIDEKNMVILGHNYKKHFGSLKNLTIGDLIEFQNINKEVNTYEVASIKTVEPTDIEEVSSEKFELTLFTCTYGGKQRTVIGAIAVP